MEYRIFPVGHVQKNETRICLVIRDEFWDATAHLDMFSHIIVLWWIDRMDKPDIRRTLLANPPRNKGPSASGVFACRSPARPNPIGHSIVKVLGLDKENSCIRVDHMDADNGTPILDIKPYLPSSDRVDNAKVAPWFENLDKRYYEN
jgi:tRNA-Thr(GGU) m(6)t(6)A37 methyltransferase TsaA